MKSDDRADSSVVPDHHLAEMASAEEVPIQ